MTGESKGNSMEILSSVELAGETAGDATVTKDDAGPLLCSIASHLLCLVPSADT